MDNKVFVGIIVFVLIVLGVFFVGFQPEQNVSLVQDEYVDNQATALFSERYEPGTFKSEKYVSEQDNQNYVKSTANAFISLDDLICNDVNCYSIHDLNNIGTGADSNIDVNLNNYVPYEGATDKVNLYPQDLTSNNIHTPYGGFDYYGNLLKYSMIIRAFYPPWDFYDGLTDGFENNVLSPVGDNTLKRIINDSNGGGYFTQEVNVSSSTYYNASLYIQGKTTGQEVSLSIINVDGSAGSTTNNIVLTDEWQRYDVTHLTSSTTTKVNFRFDNTDTPNDYVLVWGANLNEGQKPNIFTLTSLTAINQGFGLFTSFPIVARNFKNDSGNNVHESFANAFGLNSNANSQYSQTMGFNVTGSNSFAFATGSYTTASGASSASINSRNTASGSYSLAGGYFNEADTYGQTSLGTFSVPSGGTSNSWVETDPVLIVGNGVSTGSRSNAFEVYKDGNIVIPSDNQKLVFGENKASINYDGTNLVLNPKEANSGVVYVDGNISAENFITHSRVYDKEKGKALDLIKDSSEWVNPVSKEINYSSHYAGTKIQITDYSRPVKKIIHYEECRFPDGKDVLDFEKDFKPICVKKEKEIISYPYKIEKEGLNLEERIATLEQAIYELSEENKELRDLIMLRK